MTGKEKKRGSMLLLIRLRLNRSFRASSSKLVCCPGQKAEENLACPRVPRGKTTPLSVVTAKHYRLSFQRLCIDYRIYTKMRVNEWILKCYYCLVNVFKFYAAGWLRGETVTLVESLSASVVDGYICINRASQLSVTLPFCFFFCFF